MNEFHVISSVGEGKFAQISKAIYHKKDGFVALRKLKLTEASVISNSKFLREAKKLVQIVHPNIVQCFGVLLKERTFVLEFCEQLVSDCGEMVPVHSLLGLINTLEDSIDHYTKLKAICDISNGLHHLHSLGIIAGDIKPSNILVSEGWYFKIADFSVETTKRHNQTLMSTTYSNNSELTYTLYYLAPELMKVSASNSSKNDKSDIYAFAILVFEIVFPCTDFRTHVSPLQHMEAVKRHWRPHIPSKAYNDPLMAPIIDIFVKCWHEEPHHRLEASEINMIANDLLFCVSNFICIRLKSMEHTVDLCD